MKSGILIVNKEKDMTSRDVVNIACKKLNTRHIGHTGTLDPIATGVLVLGVNDGCKIIDLLTSADKVYEAEVIVGIETDTLDITGNILNTYNIKELEKEKLNMVIHSFQGKYMQEVPKYSAVHVAGKRLHEYARNKEEVVLPKKEVEIYDIQLISDIRKESNFYTFSILADVSKGTYIRSLIRDIGEKLGVSCTMKNLKRIKQGIFNLEQTCSINEISEDKLISIESALKNYDKIIVDVDTSKKVLNGMIMDFQSKTPYLLVLSEENTLLAIYQKYEKDASKMKPYRVFKG